MKRFLIWLLVAFTATGHAVSRVGGGITSNFSKADFAVDGYFPLSRETSQHGIMLTPITGGGSNPDTIVIYEFADAFPEANNLDQVAIRNLFEFTYDYTSIYHSDACVVGFYKKTPTAHTYVVTWGQSRGFVFVGNDSEFTRKAMLRMVRDVTLQPGACAWK